MFKRKKGTGELVLVFSLLLMFSISLVAAEDVAYIYKNINLIDDNVIDIFEDEGLTVDLVQENDLPINTDDYLLMYVGDERFRNEDLIPIGELPTIISNFYFGPEFGLTDGDGISKLASNSPMSVLKGNSVLQVYTQGTFDSSQIGIPYYYIDDDNKVPETVVFARTFIGGDADFGDVIAEIPLGTLLNNQVTEGNICFFGLATYSSSAHQHSSDYWTQASKDMLVDCIQFVAIECEQASDCGTDGFVGNEFCTESDDVAQEFESFTCDSPGTMQSECVVTGEDIVVEQCDNFCSDGDCVECISDNDCTDGDDLTLDECLDPGTPDSQCENTPIDCNTDTDCDDEDAFTFDTCENPGTEDSFCSYLPIECNVDSDCGIDGFEGNTFCTEDDVFDTFITYACLLPGTIDSSCSNSGEELLVESCDEICVEGSCADAPVHDVALIDFTNSFGGIRLEESDGTDILGEIPILDCGGVDYKVVVTVENIGDFEEDITFDGSINGLLFNHLPKDDLAVGGKSLKTRTVNFNLAPGTYDIIVDAIITDDNDLTDNTATRQIICKQITCENDADCDDSDSFTEDSCLLPGTFDSFCVNDPIECFIDSDCDDSNINTADICNNPGTVDSFCTNDPINCFVNSDCGINGFVGNTFCIDDDVYQPFETNSCDDAGTSSSSCSVENNNELVEVCDDTCVDGECVPIECSVDSDCDDSNINTEDICNNAGTVDSFCTNDPITCFNDADCDDTNALTLDECLNPGTVSSICENTPIDCNTDADCDDSDSFTKDTCNNPGAIDSFCTNDPIECFVDGDCGVDGFVGNTFCSDNDVGQEFESFTCNNPGLSSSFCNSDSEDLVVEQCSDVCSLGECVDVECFENIDCDDSNIFTFDVCRNPGTIISECEYFPIACNTDFDCDDFTVYTLDECQLPGTPDSFCTNDPVNCVIDADCGLNGFSDEFCFDDDVYSNLQESICTEGGTTLSFCDATASSEKLVECGDDFCEPAEFVCDGNDVVEKQICHEKGCSVGSCVEDLELVEEVVETCEIGCFEGQCIECFNDNDCGDGDEDTTDTCFNPGTAESFCVNEPIECFNDADCDDADAFTKDTCENPGTVDSFCVNDPIECFIDTDCDDLDAFTKDTCENPGTVDSFCVNDPIECFIDTDCDAGIICD